MPKLTLHINILLLVVGSLGLNQGLAQEKTKLDFDGQLSIYSSWSPDNDLDWFAGGRYIPELNFLINLDTSSRLDFEGSLNIWGSLLTGKDQETVWDGAIAPYRAWARYSTDQYEIRAGLQKIDFGSATLLRPLQWFDGIDPRDPLALTTGVYGLLGRYYFLNNANIWGWVLYGNEQARGFDPVPGNKKKVEFGGRVQLPVKKGEIGFSYNHRTASTINFPVVPEFDLIPENKYGLDGKWDLGVGLWYEAVYIGKKKEIDLLTHQTFINLGIDYTFGIGNGLNVIFENLIAAYSEQSISLKDPTVTSAINISYPFSMFDNLNLILYYTWETNEVPFFLSYEHQFNAFSVYVMLFYNSKAQAVLPTNDFQNNFAGPGARLMFVYYH